WGSSESQYPTFNEGTSTTMDYFLGYRRFEQMGLTPLYPFGYGLSYTKFSYSGLSVPCSEVTTNGVVNVSVNVQNTGTFGGDEVVELYVGFPTTTSPRRSKKELKGFARVSLAAGEMKTVTIPVRVKDLKYYDMTTNAWAVQKGT